MDSVLGQCDNIHVAFHHQDPLGLFAGCKQFVKPVNLTIFFECRGFWRIEVFGRFVPHHAPAKANHPAPSVADGKHDPVAEAVV